MIFFDRTILFVLLLLSFVFLIIRLLRCGVIVTPLNNAKGSGPSIIIVGVALICVVEITLLEVGRLETKRYTALFKVNSKDLYFQPITFSEAPEC